MNGATSTASRTIPIRWITGGPKCCSLQRAALGGGRFPKVGRWQFARRWMRAWGVRRNRRAWAHRTAFGWCVRMETHQRKAGRFCVTAYALHVEETAWDWPERRTQTAWFSPEIACRLAANDELSALIREAVSVKAPVATSKCVCAQAEPLWAQASPARPSSRATQRSHASWRIMRAGDARAPREQLSSDAGENERGVGAAQSRTVRQHNSARPVPRACAGSTNLRMPGRVLQCARFSQMKPLLSIRIE